MLGDVLLSGAERLRSSPTVASPSRSRSSSLMRIGSPRTRKRSAISSTSGSGSGWGTDVRGSMIVTIVLFYHSMIVNANNG